jgi:DNA-binding beta-propeller fold protein YncE
MDPRLNVRGARPHARRVLSLLCASGFLLAPACGLANEAEFNRHQGNLVKGESIPTGVEITPAVARGALFQPLNPDLASRPDFFAGQAVTTVTSPDGKTLLVLTSGFNRNNDAAGKPVAAESNEYVFVYDISGQTPVKRQVLQVPNTFVGMAWNPNGKEFYVSGGRDDNVHIYAQAGGAWAEVAAVALGHASTGAGNLGGLSIDNRPNAAGLAVNAAGTRLVVANHENDSVSVLDLTTRTKLAELDLRPGKISAADRGKPGGAYPFWVAIQGNSKAYVTSQRDREVVVVDIDRALVLRRIRVGGQPNKALLNKDQSLLFVANGNTDTVSTIDTASDKVVAEFATTAPKDVFENPKRLKGSNPNSLALTPDERFLLVTNGGSNSVAVIKLVKDKEDKDDSEKPSGGGAERSKVRNRVVGLIPTGRYPNSVSLSRDGSRVYVVNGKSNAGPNPAACRDSNSIAADSQNNCNAANQYIWQQTKAGFLSMPMPSGAELASLTWQVAKNNYFPKTVGGDRNEAKLARMRSQIKHVIYVIKENRTYDQVLGDLPRGNGDPRLAVFGAATTPNLHRLASNFVTLDNFLDSGEVSGDGWNWTTAGRTTDYTEKTVSVAYGGRRSFTYDWEGDNRNINVGLPTLAERLAQNPALPNDVDLLPGTADVAAPDVEGAAGLGYLWDGALRAGLTVRNYGIYVDNINAVTATPFTNGIAQAVPTKAALRDNTDLFFRGYDQDNADFYLFKEWEREFDQYAAQGTLPNLSFVRFPHDHTGNFGTAKFGVNTPDTQVADNDYAVGQLVEKVANSRFKNDTLIVVIEDDAQNGPDHMDAHRSIVFFAGPFVKQGGAVISRRYTTVNAVRTIQSVLGITPMGITDGLAEPMLDVFDDVARPWAYQAIVPEVLRTTQLPLPTRTAENSLPLSKSVVARARPRGDANYWIKAMAGQNFEREDALDEPRYNRALWKGLQGTPYPAVRHGRDLSARRDSLLNGNIPSLK